MRLFREPSYQVVGAPIITLIPCRVCGSNYMNRNEAWECSRIDMLEFVYRKLGGTFRDAPESAKQEER